jgi:hypothetical protein
VRSKNNADHQVILTLKQARKKTGRFVLQHYNRSQEERQRWLAIGHNTLTKPAASQRRRPESTPANRISKKSPRGQGILFLDRQRSVDRFSGAQKTAHICIGA